MEPSGSKGDGRGSGGGGGEVESLGLRAEAESRSRRLEAEVKDYPATVTMEDGRPVELAKSGGNTQR